MPAKEKPWIKYPDKMPNHKGCYPVILKRGGSVSEVAHFHNVTLSSPVWRDRSGNEVDVEFWADEWLGNSHKWFLSGELATVIPNESKDHFWEKGNARQDREMRQESEEEKSQGESVGCVF